ncbi:MAG: hypothetical protein OHK0023_18490 [Anaerolineae bacterium]
MGRWANKYVIGLTGNIAMGKSVVRKMLEHLGAYTIDADGLAHQTMAPGAPCYQPVIEAFGKWILDKENKIDRTKLGAVVFSHPEALSRLEQITHPVVGQGIDTLVSRAKQPIVVVEAIKLLEGALATQVDTVWVVDSTPELQLARLLEKRGMSLEEARKRIAGQNLQTDKLALAKVVLHNNGPLEDLWTHVQAEWAKLMQSLKVAQASDEVQRVTVASTSTAPSAPPTTAPAAATKPSTGKLPSIPPKTGSLTPPPTLPVRPPTQPVPTPSAAAPAAGSTTVDIRRGMPKNAESIAQLINLMSGKTLGRGDIMQAFGEKSYLLAELNGKLLGLAGFQVENLITRVDEFFIVPGGPSDVIARALIQSVEDASKQLQSEVGFVYLPLNATPQLVQSFVGSGYEPMELDAIKVPAWRDAAQESQPPNTRIMAKKLRPDRVLKPL